MPSILTEFSLKRSWITIGSFDGVHLGHQSLIKRLVEGARKENCISVVLTFDPHPAVFFKRAAEASLLTSADEREDLLHSLGVDQVITLRFDSSVANLSARDFVIQLKEHLGIRHLLAGVNFALGKDRTGDLTTLNRLGNELGLEVEVIPPFVLKGEIVSSSLIRQLLQSEQLSKANKLLGRPYRLSGQVVHGEARGSRLGFPTANMQIRADRLVPSNGVYVTRAIVNGHAYGAVTNIGVRPTFENPLATPRVEPHVLDVSDNFYDQQLDLEFIEFLRPEIKFPDTKSLIDQINLDIQKAREVLAHGT